MTCIAAFIDDGNIYMGGDSVGVNDSHDYIIVSRPKVFIRGDMIFGFTTSFRLGQILESSFEIPEKPKGKSDIDYLQSDFVDALVKCLEEKKYSRISDNVAMGGTFVLGYNKKLYKIEDDFCVLSSNLQYCTCGCGEPFADAAFNISLKLAPDMDPISRIEMALQCASDHTAVRPPFHILKLSKRRKKKKNEVPDTKQSFE